MDNIEGKVRDEQSEAEALALQKECVMRMMETLSDQQRKILSMRLGLEDGCARTLEEVNQAFHTTRDRVRQIEVRVFRSLRQAPRRRRLKDYLD